MQRCAGEGKDKTILRAARFGGQAGKKKAAGNAYATQRLINPKKPVWWRGGLAGFVGQIYNKNS